MPFRELTIAAFTEAVAEKTPTPGGGSVSALVGSFGAALGCMVVRFSFGRPEAAPIEGDMRRWLQELTDLTARLQLLADEDAAAYDGFTAASKLPKETPEQKEARRAAMQAALRKALEVPLEGMRRTLEVLKLARSLAGRSNPHLASDVAVGGLMAFAAHRGCRLNVDTNLASIKDETYAARVREEADRLEAEALRYHDDLLRVVRGK